MSKINKLKAELEALQKELSECKMSEEIYVTVLKLVVLYTGSILRFIKKHEKENIKLEEPHQGVLTP